MPAYIIAQINITDPEKYQEYAKLAAPAGAKYGAKYLVRGGAKTELEGKIPYQRIVVNEFKDVETAKRFYNSPEYQANIKIRQAHAVGDILIIEGLDG